MKIEVRIFKYSLCIYNLILFLKNKNKKRMAQEKKK